MVSHRNRRKIPGKSPLGGSEKAAHRATGPFRLAALSGLASGYAAAAVVLAVHFLVAVASVRQKSNTCDEIAHITAGYSYWTRNDYRLHPENGNLPQRWLAMPLLAMGLKFPQDQDNWAASDVWVIGKSFLFELGNDLESLLWHARCMNAVLSVGLGLLVYAWSRRLFGPGGGMISLLAYTTDPTVLANGSLATSDLAATAFFLASVGCLWKMFHRLSPGSFVLCWLVLTGLFLSKTSALLIVPMLLALLVIRLIARRPLIIAWKNGMAVERRAGQAGVLLGAMLLQAVLVVAAIWGSYGFRYAAFRDPPGNAEHFYIPDYFTLADFNARSAWKDTLADSGLFGRAIEFARDNRLLPEAYIYGTAYVYRHSRQRDAFLNGQHSKTGWWYFFPYTFLVKTPLAMFAILGLAIAGAFCGWRGSGNGSNIHGSGQDAYPIARSRSDFLQAVWDGFYATAPLWVLLAVYWASAISTHLNIGHRHILPTYPPMFVLAGAAVYWLRQSDRKHRFGPAVALGSIFLLVAGCVGTYPHYLAYFNQIVGGPRNGYKHLVDSSLDWGQDLPGLRQWLKEQNLPGPNKIPIYLSYFGTSSPEYYQIPAINLRWAKSQPMVSLNGGWYCISATELQQVYRLTPGRWRPEYEEEYQKVLQDIGVLEKTTEAQRQELFRSKGMEYWHDKFLMFDGYRMGRICAYLRQRKPDDSIGYSILLYRLSSSEIEEAVCGPPPAND